MLLTILLTTIIIASFIGFVLIDGYDYEFFKGLCAVILVISLIVLLINLIEVIIGPSHDRAFIRELQATQQTITEQRADSLTGYERATITNTIIEMNKELADRQYWATSNWIGNCYDKSILKVKPIK